MYNSAGCVRFCRYDSELYPYLVRDQNFICMENNSSKPRVFIDPTSNWGFKRLFGTPANSRLLKYLLNTIMDGPRITKVTLLDTNHPYVMSENGSSTFDVYCECDDRSEIIVEMQKCNEGNFEDRAFAYSAMAVMDQAKPKWDYRFNQVCFIGIATFNLFKTSSEYITTRRLCDKVGGKEYRNYLQIFIELPKFENDDFDLMSERDALLYLLKNLRTMDEMPQWVSRHGEEMRMLCDGSLYDKLSETEKESYDMSEEEELKWIRSVQYGREEGRLAGREEGAFQANLETAGKLKAEGLAIDVISRCTGLSRDQVEAL